MVWPGSKNGRRNTVTVDPGSNPDHDKLGGEISKVKCLLGGGGTHRTCKDGTKAC